MRLGLAFGVGATAFTTAVAGCTLLIPFDDVPEESGIDASRPDTGGGALPDAAPDADAGPPAFPPPCDPQFPIDQVVCSGTPRPTCAKSPSFASYPAGHDRTNDLVFCNGTQTASCMQHCPFGCAEMPAGFPDQCDDCNGRADGYYCGRDLRGWESASSDLAVQCQNGRAVRGAICGVGKCASKCPRAEGPLPSCCVP